MQAYEALIHVQIPLESTDREQAQVEAYDLEKRIKSEHIRWLIPAVSLLEFKTLDKNHPPDFITI